VRALSETEYPFAYFIAYPAIPRNAESLIEGVTDDEADAE
jgi:hypothetical protein